MNGKATLILKDANSGRIVKCVEEHNMVTNALKSIFDFPKCALFGSWNFSNGVEQYFPIWKNLLGGVFLFGNNIPEDPNGFMPPKNIEPVASAGRAYTGTNPARGSYNAGESGPIENGYRQVWDFTTDKANGVIRCIALTSAMAGNAGLAAAQDQSGSCVLNPAYIADAGTSNSVKIAEQKGYFIANPEPRVYCSYEIINSVPHIRSYRKPDPDALGVTDVPSDSAMISDHAVELGYNMSAYANSFYDPSENTVYFFGWESAANGMCTIKYAGADITSGGIVKRGTVNVPYVGSTAFRAAIRKNKLYMLTEGKLSAYSLSGELLQTRQILGKYVDRLFVFNNMLHFCCFYNNRRYRVCAERDNDVLEYDMYSYSAANGRDVKLPYYLGFFPESASANVNLLLAGNYLATINNLAEPLEKTNRHALQIRYELTC